MAPRIIGERLLTAIDRVRDGICILLLAAIFILINVQVFFRYVVNDPLSWPEEIARTLFLWIVFLGVAKLFRERSNYAIDFFVGKASPRMRALTAAFVDAAAIVLFIAVLIGSWPVLAANANINTVIGLPVNLLYASLPVAALLILPALATSLVARLREAAGKAVVTATSAPRARLP
jgi:TRAP-type C4-dicarboxylate transport system permease small subunit